MNENIHVARVFVGVKISPDEYFDAQLKRIRKNLQHEVIRWVKSENMHITLRFIGECKKELLPQIQESLGRIATNTTSFEIKISGIGLFRSINHPRVLWAGVSESHYLQNLQEETDKKLNSIGFSFANEHFTPHLTLGRMKKINNRPATENLINEYKGIEFMIHPVESIILYESVLKPGSTAYLPLYEHYFL